MCVTLRHDMTLAVEVALILNTTNQLTFCQAIPSVIDLGKEDFKKNVERKKMWVIGILLYPPKIFFLYKDISKHWIKINLSCANAFNLTQILLKAA